MNTFKELIKSDLFHWEQLQELLQKKEIYSNQEFNHELQTLALGSNYAIAQLVKYPDLIEPLSRCRQFELEEHQLTEALQGLTDIDQIKHQLRIYRHQKLVEIIYLDICRKHFRCQPRIAYRLGFGPGEVLGVVCVVLCQLGVCRGCNLFRQIVSG